MVRRQAGIASPHFRIPAATLYNAASEPWPAAQFLDREVGEARHLARAIYEYWDKLYTQLEHQGAEHANNVSEETRSQFMLIRKITHGNGGAKGKVAS